MNMAERMIKKYHQFKNAGLCVVCGKVSAQENKTKCKPCAVGYAAYKRKYRKAGKCSRCFHKLPDDWAKKLCLDCRNVEKQKYYRRRATRACVMCGAKLEIDTTIKKCKKCTERGKIDHKNTRIKLKQQIFEIYGNKCACCGEAELGFLSIDHINNDGAAHRRKDNLHGGGRFYRWLKTNNFPSGFQILCMNCNMSKHKNGGICIHQLKKKEYETVNI